MRRKRNRLARLLAGLRGVFVRHGDRATARALRVWRPDSVFAAGNRRRPRPR